MDHDEARARLLDAAERLFYERGIQAVGMDELRSAAGVSLKRLYQCFPSKNDLVEEYLRRRDDRWRTALSDYATRHAATPEGRLLAVFDWLQEWFAAPGFRGCAFVNSFGELGAVADGVARAARDHKHAVREYMADLARDLGAGDPSALAGQLVLLVDGAITTAAISGDPAAARHARTAAETLIAAATAPVPPRA
ncbi:TetR/AcrR family transcriptional regulator [Streptomyces sp. P1-3]|uniref:TetR/AcrR family transcriptional regulator n=1 Tax=Streptomyces sp. P1-3 TaxID=3421658 RepID=UPI003D36C694